MKEMKKVTNFDFSLISTKSKITIVFMLFQVTLALYRLTYSQSYVIIVNIPQMGLISTFENRVLQQCAALSYHMCYGQNNDNGFC